MVNINPFVIAFEERTAISSRNYFFKKEGFFKTFVVLVLRYRKIEKD
jgi:hypothetical protein